MALSRRLTSSRTLPKSGSFPPPALPGFIGPTSLSATSHAPACPSRASGWEARLPPLGFPVLRGPSLCRHAIAITPVATREGIKSFPPGVYSMTGTTPPLRKHREIADAHDAILYLDDAHATGVYGQQGRGTVHDALGDYPDTLLSFIRSAWCGTEQGSARCTHF